MSKVNRRKEIKDKEALQARFQLSISQNNAKALSWLKPSTSKTGQEHPISTESFLDLPIIPSGSSLTTLNNGNVSKIGDFMKNDGSMNAIKQESGPRAAKNASKPMLALMNKVRDYNKEKIRKNGDNNVNNSASNHSLRNQKIRKVEKHPQDEDSDDESSILKARSVKKGSNMLLENKLGKKKMKGRPF
ncbi:predicted protein [Scheffersomyces stipitis CBS 6054]|uniref:Uncharacterized protein n=1 Tax=Scheffersomyces stipitis (strain ATCC 58785 / CBS 6054 / NBRC 10063 / NRRL Y-11545) TaxID=322104 RepID=A3LNQ7_PICST|nr:predicted protein [Scheffersomyces stipitis CBS 6054]ABN64904.1 predicted protein [Scheffersomyces stipitis CBS 6054]KAG2736485.1 hypothetical protein G9P44_000575 [Scheffersomyces stipitis]